MRHKYAPTNQFIDQSPNRSTILTGCVCVYVCAAHFLVPFYLLLVVIALPVCYVQIKMGALYRRGIVATFAHIVPILKGRSSLYSHEREREREGGREGGRERGEGGEKERKKERKTDRLFT